MFSLQGGAATTRTPSAAASPLLDVLRHAGLRVVWNDNQSGCKGVCAGVETMRPDPATLPHCVTASAASTRPCAESSWQLLRDADRQPGARAAPARQPRFGLLSAVIRTRSAGSTPTCDDEDLSKCSASRLPTATTTPRCTPTTYRARHRHAVGTGAALRHRAALRPDHGTARRERPYLHGLPGTHRALASRPACRW